MKKTRRNIRAALLAINLIQYNFCLIFSLFLSKKSCNFNEHSPSHFLFDISPRGSPFILNQNTEKKSTLSRESPHRKAFRLCEAKDSIISGKKMYLSQVSGKARFMQHVVFLIYFSVWVSKFYTAKKKGLRAQKSYKTWVNSCRHISGLDSTLLFSEGVQK